MSADLTKKAAEMLLNGATLLGESCPYCGGVRVIKDGNALCINCGKRPEKSSDNFIPQDDLAIKTLESAKDTLLIQMQSIKDSKRQKKILQCINSLIQSIDTLKE